MAVRLSAVSTGRALLTRNIIFLLLVLISVRVCVNPRPSAAGRIRYNEWIQSPHRVSNPRPSDSNNFAFLKYPCFLLIAIWYYLIHYFRCNLIYFICRLWTGHNFGADNVEKNCIWGTQTTNVEYRWPRERELRVKSTLRSSFARLRSTDLRAQYIIQ
jgi:hypothetical protein